MFTSYRLTEYVFQLLTSKDFRRGSKSDEAELLQQIRATNADAGRKYLEHLVLRRRSQVVLSLLQNSDGSPESSKDSDLHDQLASICIDQVLEGVDDSATSKLWRAKGTPPEA